MTPTQITHVVTYASASGSYGGPLTVARNQCAALAEKGCQVTLVSGWDGDSQARDELASYRQRFFKTHLFKGSFATAFSWKLLYEVLRSTKSTVYHLHFARGAIPLSVALALSLLGRKYVIQPHGMIVQDDRLVLRIIDKLFIKHILSRSIAVIALSQDEVRTIQFLSPNLAQTHIVPNAVPERPVKEKVLSDPMTVGFVARLHPRKNVMLFAQAAKHLLAEEPDKYKFKILGADEGDLSRLLSFMQNENLMGPIEYDGALPGHRMAAYLQELDILVAPAQNEPFGMSALEALAEGVPVVMSEDAGLFDYVKNSTALVPSRSDAEHLASAIKSMRFHYSLRSREAFDVVRQSGLGASGQAERLIEIYGVARS